MKLNYFLGACLTVLSFSVFSQNFSVVNEHYFSEEYSIPNYVEFDQNQLPVLADLEAYLQQYWKGKEDFDLRLKSSFIDQQEAEHLKYVQTYQGADIEIAEWVLHLKNGKVTSMHGKLISDYPKASGANLSEAEALNAAISWIGADVYKWEIPEEEAFIKRHEDDPSATFYPKGELSYMSKKVDLNPDELRLCYKFNVYAHEPMSRQEIYVDAQNGEIILSNSLINNTDVPSTGVTGYSGTRSITTDSLAPNSFRLRQTTSGGGVRTFDMNRGTTYGNAVDFTNNSSTWNIANTQLDQYAIDAHWATEQTYDYMFNKFGRNSINNAGLVLTSYVHYDNNYVNAFWNGQFMTYGDGNGGGITPLTPLDIVGHEIGHGLTAFTADLIYNRESGALNESFSDILGNSVEFYARPNRANWTMGEDIGITIRNMANPNQYGDPDTYGGRFWVNQVGCVPTQANNLCGIHTNMGVQNFWYYLVSAGGAGVNDNGQSYNVTGISLDSAAAIAYRNLTVYLLRSSNFQEARFFSIRAAVDLFGACSPEVQTVTNAWHAVGVGNRYVPGVNSIFASLDTTACQPPHTVTFTNNSSNGITYSWDFGDGTTSTQMNPTKTYTSFGQFDVSLITDGGSCGRDTLIKQAYIDIDTSYTCVALLNDGNNPTQTTCNGRMYDSGGSSADYSDNETGTITIAPAGASSVTLTFAAFDVEAGANGTCNYDYLEIYDGPNTSSTLIGRYCNNTGSPGIVSSTGGAITLRFFSDQAVTESGFDLTWACSYPSAVPGVDFTVDADSSCTGLFQFTDGSSQLPNAWMWDFGDGNTSNLQNPQHQYASNGNFNVKLIATNAFGSDSLSKSNFVNVQRPQLPVVANDTICQGQTSTLNATASGTIKWYNQASGGAEIATGSSFTTPALNADRSYFVENLIPSPLQSVGPPNNNFGGGGFGSFDRHLIFDVFQPLILQTVTAYANSAGNRLIQLRDDNGNVLQSQIANLSVGMNVITLDFNIAPGTDYQLGLPAGSPINLYRHNSGLSYPYTIPNFISIKSSNASRPTGFYYYFYDWKVKEEDCYSAREEVIVKIDSTCSITGLKDINQSNDLLLYPNPTTGDFTIKLNSNNPIKQVQLFDLSGKAVSLNIRELNTNGQTNVSTSNLPDGIYILQVDTNSGLIRKKLTVINQ